MKFFLAIFPIKDEHMDSEEAIHKGPPCMSTSGLKKREDLTSASLGGTPSPRTSLINTDFVIYPFRVEDLLKASLRRLSSPSVTGIESNKFYMYSNVICISVYS